MSCSFDSYIVITYYSVSPYRRWVSFGIMSSERVIADFQPLNISSSYSFLTDEPAVSSPGKLASVLSQYGYMHFPLSDTTLLSEGRVFQSSEKHQLRPIPGLRFSMDVYFGPPQEGFILPRNDEGLRRLHGVSSRKNIKGEGITPDDIHKNKEDWYTFFTGPISPYEVSTLLLLENVFRAVKDPQEIVAAHPAFAGFLHDSKKIVVAPEVRIALPEDTWKLAWLAKASGKSLPYELATYALKTPDEMRLLYAHYKDALGLSAEIAKNITIVKPLPPDIQPETVKPGWTPEAYLRLLAHNLAGLPENAHLSERIKEEVTEITEARYAGLVSAIFLVKEVIEFCKSAKIPIKTTGSANNSVLLSLLGVTQVEPDEANDCDFSRFLNSERVEKPDIDMEVGYKDREAILAFLKRKYGAHAAEIIIPHFMKDKTVEQYIRRKHIPAIPNERIVQLVAEEIPFKLQPHGSKVVLLGNAPFRKLGEEGKLVADIDRIDAEKIFDYTALDFLPRQGPQRLHLAQEFARKRRTSIVDTPNNSAVMRRIFSGDTMGIPDVESPHMQQTLQKFHLVITQPTRETLADAIAISKVRKGVRDRYLSYRYRGKELLSTDVMHDLGLRSPVIYHQEDLAIVARAAGFSLSQEEAVRKMLSDRDVTAGEKEEIIQKIIVGLGEHGYSKRVQQELRMQMESYVGYVLVRGHALSLAHGAEQVARHAVYDPVGFSAAILTTVAEYWNRSDYTFQGYVNDVLRHKVQMDFSSTRNNIPETPEIWQNKIAVSTSMLRAGFGGKLPDDFAQRYALWVDTLKEWKKGAYATADLVHLEWELFHASFTHNPILRFDSNVRFDPGRDKQEIIVQPIAARELSESEVYLLTLDSETVFRASMPTSKGKGEDFSYPFLKVRVQRSNGGSGGWEIKEILSAHA